MHATVPKDARYAARHDTPSTGTRVVTKRSVVQRLANRVARMAAWLAPCAAAMIFIAAPAFGATPFQEVSIADATHTLRLSVTGLPALSNPNYTLSEAVVAQPQKLVGTQNDPFTAPARGANFWTGIATWCEFLCDVTYQPRFLFGELLPGEAPDGAILTIGVDHNGDSTPQPGEALCEATLQGSTPAQCFADLGFGSAQGSLVYWVAVKTQDGAPVTFHEAVAQPIPSSTISGPGHAPAGATLPLRLWGISRDPTTALAGQRYYGVAEIRSNTDDSLRPYAVTTTAAVTDPVVDIVTNPVPDAGFNTFSFALPPASTLLHAYLDVPATLDGSTRPIEFSFVMQLGQDRSLLDAYLVREDFPAASRDATIGPAPPTDSQTFHVFEGAAYSQFSLAPGRWYLRLRNASTATAYVSVSLSFTTDAPQTPLVAPGFYYNPQRSGHGIAISQASGQQVLDWFTYLEDGTPQWFEAQAPVPPTGYGWWRAPLYRVAWDGSKAHLSQIGTVTLTPVADNDFMFTWQVESAIGSEHFSALARSGACPSFNGTATNFTGAWYAPTQSGYGMDVLSLPEQQFAAFYFYDDLGLARWGVGGSVPFASSSTLTLTQNTGFCPSCSYTPVTMQPLGTVDVRYDSASGGNFSSNLVLKAPLSGSWNVSNAMSRLTGSAVCQ